VKCPVFLLPLFMQAVTSIVFCLQLVVREYLVSLTNHIHKSKKCLVHTVANHLLLFAPRESTVEQPVELKPLEEELVANCLIYPF